MYFVKFLCHDFCVASFFNDVLVLSFCVRFGSRRYGFDEMSGRQYTHGFDWICWPASQHLWQHLSFICRFPLFPSCPFASLLLYPVSFQVINACGHIFTDIISLDGFLFHEVCWVASLLISCLFDAFQFNSMVHGLTFSFLCESLLG